MHPAHHGSSSSSSDHHSSHNSQQVTSATPILKVMRLQSPEFGQISSGTLDGKGTLTPLLALPDSFGVIHVGETFTAYLGVLNVSDSQMVTKLTVTAALQTPSRRFTLPSNLDESNNRGGSTVVPGKGVDAIVSRALEEVGQHILRVEVGYGGGDSKSLRKFYRFNVANPLHIRELTMRAGDASCFVSIAIENVTSSSSLSISSADFHPPHGLVSEMIGGPKCSGELVKEFKNNPSSLKKALSPLELFDNCGRLDPGESFRYLFHITAASHDAKLRGIAAGDELGKAIFTWKKAMGESGRIASASVQCPPTTNNFQNQPVFFDKSSSASNSKFVVHGSGLSVDVAAAAANRSSSSKNSNMEDKSSNYESNLDDILPVTVEPIDPPSTMHLGVPTEVQLLIVNHSEKPMTLQLQLRSQHMSGVVVCGSSYKNLGQVQPSGGSCVIGVRLVPLVAGLFRVQGCWIVDLISGREISQPPLFHTFVEKGDIESQ